MARKSKIVGFSLPPEVSEKLEKYIKAEHKTRSEFFRGLIDMYSKSLDEEKRQIERTGMKFDLEYADLGKVLAFYWDLKSKMSNKVIPIGLAVIENEGKVLIGRRKEKDKWVRNLSWVFPGGKFSSFELESDLVKVVKKETGLNIKVNSLISSRLHPDSGFKEVQIVALYFHCSVVKPIKPKAGDDLKDIIWVKPTEVYKHFTTSSNDEVAKFLMTIEKGF
ncbi:NUDIX domain-containing protein [Patescibacteria group bacterium]